MAIYEASNLLESLYLPKIASNLSTKYQTYIIFTRDGNTTYIASKQISFTPSDFITAEVIN
jgi:hypothetical protein